MDIEHLPNVNNLNDQVSDNVTFKYTSGQRHRLAERTKAGKNNTTNKTNNTYSLELLKFTFLIKIKLMTAKVRFPLKAAELVA